MTNTIQKLENTLLESNRLQDIGSKRLIPAKISQELNDSKNITLDNIIDYNDMSKVKSIEI